MTEELEDSRMPPLQHLQELSLCLKNSLIAIFIAAVLSFVWASELFDVLCKPLNEHFGDAVLIGTGPAEAFLIKLKVSIFAGFLLSSPYWFYQLWNFVSPGLYKQEKRFAVPFVIGSTACFFTGITFCYAVIFPFAFEFFLGEFQSIGVEPTIRIGEYLSFVVRLVLVFGIVFELPILSYFLARLRIIDHVWLMQKGRYAIVVVFVAAAILTPPDFVTQILLALPLIVLYALCILIAYLVRPIESSETEAPARVDQTSP